MTATPLHCVLKPHPEGGYVLLTVNVDDAVLQATFTFDHDLKSAATLFENEPAVVLAKDKRSFESRYEPFEVHVYRLQ